MQQHRLAGTAHALATYCSQRSRNTCLCWIILSMVRGVASFLPNLPRFRHAYVRSFHVHSALCYDWHTCAADCLKLCSRSAVVISCLGLHWVNDVPVSSLSIIFVNLTDSILLALPCMHVHPFSLAPLHTAHVCQLIVPGVLSTWCERAHEFVINGLPEQSHHEEFL
jgi:hypothetical protein